MPIPPPLSPPLPPAVAALYAGWTTDQLISEVERLRDLINAREEADRRQALPPIDAVRGN